MKRSYLKLLVLLLIFIALCLTGFSSIHASEPINTDASKPESNSTANQVCGELLGAIPASKKVELEVLKTAKNELSVFLGKIKHGEENKFGFMNSSEIKKAAIGNVPYQMFVRCENTTLPTNQWRVPVKVKSQIRSFITIELIDNKWEAAAFGAAKLAEEIEAINKNLLIRKGGLKARKGLHHIIIRDYKKLTDSVLIRPYVQEGYEKSNILFEFPEIIQEQDQWCWAGVSAAVFEFYKKSVKQCEIAEYTREVATWRDFGPDNCCTNPNNGCNYWNYNWGTLGSIKDILESMQSSIKINNLGLSRKLELEEIQDDLSKNKPFVIRWGWDTNGGHFLVGYGIDGRYLKYMDPWYGEGHNIGTYNWVSKGGGHTWTHTNRITGISILM